MDPPEAMSTTFPTVLSTSSLVGRASCCSSVTELNWPYSELPQPNTSPRSFKASTQSPAKNMLSARLFYSSTRILLKAKKLKAVETLGNFLSKQVKLSKVFFTNLFSKLNTKQRRKLYEFTQISSQNDAVSATLVLKLTNSLPK